MPLEGQSLWPKTAEKSGEWCPNACCTMRDRMKPTMLARAISLTAFLALIPWPSIAESSPADQRAILFKTLTPSQTLPACFHYQTLPSDTVPKVAATFNLSAEQVLSTNPAVLKTPTRHLEGLNLNLCGESVHRIYEEGQQQLWKAGRRLMMDKSNPNVPSSTANGTDETASQVDGLLLVKAAVDGESTVLDDWQAARPICSWRGITCDASGHVITIALPSMDLQGRLPSAAALQALPKLTNLQLHNNCLTGKLESRYSTLTKLQVLDLAANRLRGTLPLQWSNMSALVALSVSGNQITGSLPKAWGALSRLRELQLQRNVLTGTIPAEWFNMASLTRLDLGYNMLTGTIPHELGRLQHLVYLVLSQNKLSGPIPRELSGLAQLYSLQIEHNSISGSIPSELGSLKHLVDVRFQGNKDLSGCWPRAWEDRVDGPSKHKTSRAMLAGGTKLVGAC